MPNYLIYGKDSFRKQLRLNALKAQHLEPGLEALNLLEIVNPELNDFCNLIQMPAWGFSTKVIVVKNFKYLENKAEDADIESILRAVDGLGENIVVIFDSDKVTGTIKLVKNLKTKSSVEEYNSFSPWEAQKAGAWLRELNSNLSPDIAEFLAEYVGTEDSGKLYSELKRLETLGRIIDTELIEEECKSKHDIFRFIQKLALKDKAGAALELERIIAAKEAHLGVVSIIETVVSKYLKLKLAEEQRLPQNQQAELIGVSPQRLYHQRKECSSMKINELEKLLATVLETERNIKTGKMPLERALRVLVQK